MMPLFDTHAHLTDGRFAANLPDVLARAAAAGLTRVICIGTTAADSAAGVRIAEQYPLVRAAVGLQPNDLVDSNPGDWDVVVRLAEHPLVVALGETGLDRHWDRTPFAVQEDYFARHLDLGRRTGLPVVIHCREAEADVVRMLRADFDRHGPVRGVLHSFTGDWPADEVCLAMALFVAFAALATFKSADDLRAVAAKVPADRLLVETDSPYLAPVPVRGKRNEPAYVAHTAACLAGVRGVPGEELAAATTRNAEALF